MQDTIGYDVETGLFWCNSRYYNPEWGRWISPDSIEYLDPESIDGLNLYAYCGNNPVNRYDPSGHAWDVVLDIGFIAWDIYNLFTNDGHKDWKNWASLGFDLVFAVLPFVTGGGGQVVKLANVGDDLHDLSKVTVVGETMSRVQTVSQFVNAADNLYDGYQMYGVYSSFGKIGKVAAEVGGKLDNAVWLLDKLQRVYNVVDIGIDIGRGAGKILGRSSSYALERLILWTWKNRNIIKFFSHLDFQEE